LSPIPSYLIDHDIAELSKIKKKGIKIIISIYGDNSDFRNELENCPFLIEDSKSESSSYKNAWTTDLENLKLIFEGALKNLESNESIEKHQIFLSHTKKDEHFCDSIDSIAARIGLKSFRSEYEDISSPSWEMIKKEINRSSALFLLIGKELARNQEKNAPEWRYTQNWIAYEIGLACQLGIDVWIICDEDVTINFPVPYFNNYLPCDPRNRDTFNYLKEILTLYRDGSVSICDIIDDTLNVKCPYDDCRIEFALHATVQPWSDVVCPQCLRRILFRTGHLIK
jgi:hypothetical protein